ncbi:hypothetical protein J7E26_06940 [Bacillus sp. ISL-51]|uniref:XkdW family protein n=1 Tax=Bacteria TaxID=2 RepID=UPI001BE50D5F|nr:MULTISPECIES: XkdW family protein [Bacteria]MBT2573688.1 hypothetical protein [Bacillus sp. ISL-51]MBT2633953.1 hypothetical protein [Bacillus sp. ISL-26]MBT2712456.1 hypothetical protein [Pseudomonas sp. ISL-88]
MKLIFPYGNDKIYLGRPVELYPDSKLGDYIMPSNATDLPPEINGEGMWRPYFDEEKQEWTETADQAYKDSLKKGISPASNPSQQIYNLGQQLANEKLARKAAEQAQQTLGMQLAAEVLAKQEAKHVNQFLGEQLAALKLDVMNLKGEMKNETS